MKKIRLLVKTKSKKYPIIIGSNIINQIYYLLNLNNINFEKSLIVFDKNVPKKKLNIIKQKLKTKSVNLTRFASFSKKCRPHPFCSVFTTKIADM